MTFLLLAIQSAVCVFAVWTVKRFGIITCEFTAAIADWERHSLGVPPQILPEITSDISPRL